MRNLRWMLVASAAGAAMAIAGPVSAADAPATAVVTEVIVTAQKREETVQEVPGVITAITGDRIKQLGISNVENLATQISGLTFYTQAGANFVTLRGVGVPVDTGVADNNVSITVDGVVIPRQTEAGIDSPDLQRVEVLRGPQGTLYGRNATGGAINYISAPPTAEFSGSITGKAANYDTWAANGFVSGPLSNHVRFRLSAGHEERNQGYVKNVFTGGTFDRLKRDSVRGALSIDLTPRLTADLSVFWQQERFEAYQALLPPGLTVPFAPAGQFGNLGSFGLVEGRDFSTKPFEIASNYNEPSHRRSLLSIAKLRWEVSDNISVTSLTGYLDHTFRSAIDAESTSYAYAHIPASGPIPRLQPAQSFSQEFNVSGALPRRGSWLVGAYYFHEDVNFQLPVIIDSQASTTFVPGTVSAGGFQQTTESYALFGDATLGLTDNLRVFAGARISKEKLDGQSVNKTTNPNGLFRPALVPLLPALFKIPAVNPTAISCINTIYQVANTQPGFPNEPKFSQDHTPFTPRVGVQYDVRPNIMVYAQYSRGFKAGGHATANCANDFAPETLESYEAGVKAQFFDKRLTVDASAFHYDYKNMQIFKLEGNGTSLVENAQAKIDGIDLTVEALLSEHLRADVSATMLDDRFTDFCSTDPSWRTLATACANGNGTGQNLDGRALPNVPNYTVNAGLDAVFPVKLGLFDRLVLRGEARLVGPTQLTSYGNRPQTRQSAWEMFNATVTLDGDKGLQVRGFVRNLTNEAVLAHVIWTGQISGQYLPPRTYGVEVTKRF
jgi:iron complex outermembrane receptor protein